MSDTKELERQIEIQRRKKTNRGIDLYDNAFDAAIPGGIVAYLKSKNHPVWVDLGCGDGKALEDVGRLMPNLIAVGIDVRDDVVMSKYPQFKQGIGQEGLYFSKQELDANNNVVLPEECHLITCLMLDRYLEDILPVVISAINALSTDGEFVITISAAHYVRDRKYKKLEFLKDYLMRLLQGIGGSLVEHTAGNKDRHLGDYHTDVWVIKKGTKPVKFDFQFKESGPISDGGYYQEYWVD